MQFLVLTLYCDSINSKTVLFGFLNISNPLQSYKNGAQCNWIAMSYYDWRMQYLDAKLFDLIRILLLLILQIILANICTLGQISIIFFEFVSQSRHYRPLFRKISANWVFFFCLFIVETEVLIVLHALFNIDLLLFI